MRKAIGQTKPNIYKQKESFPQICFLLSREHKIFEHPQIWQLTCKAHCYRFLFGLTENKTKMEHLKIITSWFFSMLMCLTLSFGGLGKPREEREPNQESSTNETTVPAPREQGMESASEEGKSSGVEAQHEELEEIPSLEEILKDTGRDAFDEFEGDRKKAKRSASWIEHHGYFRLRTEGFYRAHLGTHYRDTNTNTLIVTSGFLPPLTDNIANAVSPNRQEVGPQGEDWLAGANIRFRYRPVIHVSPSIAIHAEIDVFDNLILGSTPDYYPDRPDAPMALFSRSQAPEALGVNALKDSIRAKQAYVIWDVFTPVGQSGPFMRFSAGRMATHWGLGIVENDGEGIDANFGTYVDRASIMARLFGYYFNLAYGWVASGPSSASPKVAFGEPHDLTDKDDVTEITFYAFSMPLTEPEKRARYQRLRVKNKPCLDYGIYFAWRRQKYDIEQEDYKRYIAGEIDPSSMDVENGYNSLSLIKRNAWVLTSDAWVKFEWFFQARKKFRLELEAAGIVGRVGGVLPSDPAFSMELRSFGFAFESEFQFKNLSFGFDTGLATGDSAEYFGFLDRSNFVGRRNDRLASFYFNPDYHVDNLLFRRVIGTVTNATYFKPWIQYDLFDSEKDALGGRLSIMYARAVEKTATPGDDANLGVEMNLKLFYEEKDFISAGIEWAVLWPLGAFDLIPSFPPDNPSNQSKTSRWSTALRAVLGIQF